MKNYILFLNDHSGSMSGLTSAAARDYNATIKAIKDAATAEMLDTVVFVTEVGVGGAGFQHAVVASNPHVLREKTKWIASGGTPMNRALESAIEVMHRMPDIAKEDVSVLVMITSDGDFTDVASPALLELMKKLQATGRWTFVARLPAIYRKDKVAALNIPQDNILSWETTSKGMEAASVKTQAAVSSYFTARSAGLKSSSSFYADASKVDITSLTDISKKVSLYVVPAEANGIEIRDFVLTKRMEYLKGSAFYQLTKTEAKVGHQKQILVRDRASGKVFAGAEARQMIGLPTDRNARLHPGDHKNFDLFIQSESVNRKLVGGTGLLYWAEIGVPFTATDLAYLQPKAPTAAAPAAPAVVQLPAVPVSTTPTKSPIPVTPQFVYFETREEARIFAANVDVRQSDILRNPTGPKGKKWSIPTRLIASQHKALIPAAATA